MKKATILFSAIAIAAATQAAQITWGSGLTTLPDGTTAGRNAVSAYVFILDGKTTYDNLDLTKAWGDYMNDDGTTKSAPDADAKTGRTGATDAKTTAADTEGTTQYAVVFYVYKDGDDVYYKANKSYDTINSMGGASGNPVNLASSIATWTKAGSSSGGQDPVPEPTTVALLALGLAAVGLKRKVA